MALKSKKNTGLRGYVEGGMVGDQEPLVKKTTPPPTESIMNDPSLYNSEAFRKSLSKYKNTLDSKGNIIKQGIPVNPKLGGIQMSGEEGANRSRLVNSIKQRQEMLDTYLASNKKTSLTAKEANDVLVGGNMGTYNDYISQANDYGEYRNLTVVPEQKLNTTTDLLPDSKRYGTAGASPEGTGNVYSWQETTPYDLTHSQKMFPKNTYVAPAKANGGGIKGLAFGGDIQENEVRDTSQRKYKSGFVPMMQDYVIGQTDNTFSTFGGSDIIKSKDYQTEFGATKANQFNEGVSTIGPGIGGSVVGIFNPTAGAAIKGGAGAIKNADGEDEGLDAETTAKQGKAGAAFSTIGSLVAGKGKKQSESAEDDATVPSLTDTTLSPLTQSNQQQQSPAQVTDGNNLTGQALTDWKSAQTGEGQASVLAKYNSGGYSDGFSNGGEINEKKKNWVISNWNRSDVGELEATLKYAQTDTKSLMGTEEIKVLKSIIEQKKKPSVGKKSETISDYNQLADGGKIVGKGTGTSDSIKAEMQDDGFVVPAVNAKIAQELRAKYLGDPKSKIASLHKGKVPVKVSDGEHYFTKSEKAILESNGVDLNKLAPNADDSSNQKAKGGSVNKELAWQKWSNQNWDPTSGQSEKEARKLFEADFVKGEGAVPSTTGVGAKKYNPFERIDAGQGVALAQTGLGLTSLMQDGKRPEDSISPEFTQTVEDAKADSQFGFTPLQMQNANRSIEKNRASDVQNIINLSGGSAGTALANIRGAGISANEAKNNLTAQSEALRLQKKRYADSKVAEKAGMSKQLFNEKLNAFNVDQEAGAGLLSAGIGNLIGGQRYQSELEAQKKRESMYNPTFNIA